MVAGYSIPSWQCMHSEKYNINNCKEIRKLKSKIKPGPPRSKSKSPARNRPSTPGRWRPPSLQGKPTGSKWYDSTNQANTESAKAGSASSTSPTPTARCSPTTTEVGTYAPQQRSPRQSSTPSPQNSTERTTQ